MHFHSIVSSPSVTSFKLRSSICPWPFVSDLIRSSTSRKRPGSIRHTCNITRKNEVTEEEDDDDNFVLLNELSTFNLTRLKTMRWVVRYSLYYAFQLNREDLVTNCSILIRKEIPSASLFCAECWIFTTTITRGSGAKSYLVSIHNKIK